ncbi:MAG: complex I NDUFA9 subunit family protein [Gammaproteobacteria bacterium]
MVSSRVTVFGGTGFLGRRIVEQLAVKGASVRVAVRHPKDAVPPQRGNIEAVYADVRDPTSVAQAIKDCEAVVNAVGLYVEQRDATFQAVHVEGARHVAQEAAQAGVGRLVHISGIGVDANSESAYVRARALGESAVLEAFKEATILRPSVLFGPGDALFRSLAAITRISPLLPLFGGGATRLQPVFVGDVVEAVVKVLGEPSSREKVYELGGPKVYSYRALVDLLIRHLKRRRLLVPIPFFLWELQATLFQFLPSPPVTRDQVALMKRDNVVSEGALTFADLGITPTPVETELSSYL